MFKPSKGMIAEAKKGLAWRQEYGRGGTAVGVTRARDISNGKNLSLSTVKRMRSFFARHEVDKQGKGFSPGEDGYPSRGRIAWALWGGDPGKTWSEAIVRRESEKESMNEISVPRSALNSTPEMEARFELQPGTESDDRMRFRMVANSGDIVSHSYWGESFALDLQGIKIGKSKKPLIRDHNPSRPVGYSTKIEVTEEGLVAEGYFVDTPDGREVQNLLAQGFPLQASVYVPAKRIQKLTEGETDEVNGKAIEGPGHVFREFSLRELTVTTLGAFEETSVSMFSEPVTINASITQREEVAVSEPAKFEEVAFTESHQEETGDSQTSTSGYVEQLTEAVTKERERVLTFMEAALSDQNELLTELIRSGTSETEGLRSLLSDNKERSAERLAHQLNASPEPVGPMTDDSSDPRTIFESNPELMEQFGGDFDVYQAFTAAKEAGQIRGRVE